MATLTVNIDSPPIPTGNTLWVDAVNGNDTTGTSGRQDLPFLTAQAAINASSAGDTVYIRAGVYTAGFILKNGVDINCDAGVLFDITANTINQAAITDNNIAVVCSIFGKPSITVTEGASAGGYCINLKNASTDILVDLGDLVGDTSDTDTAIFMEGGRIRGNVASIQTTSYDGIWLASEACSASLRIDSIVSGDNPIEVTACAPSIIQVGHLQGNGISIITSNETADIRIVAATCLMTGPSFCQTIGTGGVSAMLSLGRYDAGGGVGFSGLCEGATVQETTIYNSTNAVLLAGDGGYQFDGGVLMNCVLVSSGSSVDAPSAQTIIAEGANTVYQAVGANVTVRGNMQVEDGPATAGQVPVATARGTWEWGNTVAQVTGLTLLDSGWSLVGGLYEYDLAHASILATSIVEVIPDNADVAIVQAAVFLPRTDSSAGSVKVYATNEPTADIGVTINIYYK